jgi:hypothetical protein
MKILILSTSYYENVLIRLFGFLPLAKEDDIPKMYVLHENHFPNEFVYNNISLPVTLVDTLDEAIRICDMVFVLDYKNCFKEDFLINVQLLTQRFCKKLAYVDFMDNVERLNSSDNYLSIIDQNTPTILIVSIGEFTQISVCETIVSRLLYDCKISARNLWSKKTQVLYDQIMTIYSQELCNNKNPNDILIKTLEIDAVSDFYSGKHIDDIISINPDYLIVLVEDNCDYLDSIDDIFKYKYNCKINKLIVSDYYQVLWDNLSLPIKSSTPTNLLSLVFDENYRETFKNDILLHISLPDGILPIAGRNCSP